MRAEVEEMLQRTRRKPLPEPTLRRHLRVQVGWTQEQVAQVIRCDRASISRYEAGRQPAPRIAERYAELLKRLAQEAL